MIISSAYIFAKQITAWNPPLADNVLFENGTFNKNLSYSDVGMDNQIITVGQNGFATDGFANWGNMTTDGTLFTTVKDYFHTGKMFQFLGPNAGTFVIEGGNLVSETANPNPDSGTRYDTDCGSILIPTNLTGTTYSKLFAEVEFAGDCFIDQYGKSVYVAQVTQWIDYDQTVRNKMVSKQYKYAEYTPVGVTIEVECDNGTFDLDAMYVGIQTMAAYTKTIVKKIWFE